MTPIPRHHSIEAHNSLEDSAFEIITNDTSFLASDDEDAHTESLASTDGYTGDDASSVGYIDDIEDEESSGEDLGSPTNEYTSSLEASEIIEVASDSEMTTRPFTDDDTLFRSTSLPRDDLLNRTENDFWKDTWEVEAFDQSNMPTMYRQYRMPSLRILRHLTHSERILRLDDDFRVWYFGEPDHKAEILEHIGSALYVGKSLSHGSQPASDSAIRYNITPVSSFTGDVTLLPSSGLEFYASECAVQHVNKGKGNERPAVRFLLDDKMEIDIQSDGSVRVPAQFEKHFRIPNIAVFCHTPSHQCMEDSYAHESMLMTRSAIIGLEIPVLDVYAASTLPKGAEKFTFEPKSLYMSLEGEKGQGEDPQTIAVYPISLEKFRELDPILLNQHLECITRTYRHQGGPVNSGVSFSLYNWIPLRAKQLSEAIKCKGLLFPMVSSLILVIVFLGLASSLSVLKAMGINQTNATLSIVHFPTSVARLPAACQADMTETLHANPSATIRLSSSGSSVPIKEAEMGLGQPLLPFFFTKTNQSARFKVYVTGGHYITLIPPKSLLDSKRAPHIIVSVSRGSLRIHTEIKKLADYVHLVEIPRAEAFGSLNVTIRTNSKPLVNQTVELDFGTSWLALYPLNHIFRISDLFRSQLLLAAIQVEAEKAQLTLSNMSRPLVIHMQGPMAKIGDFGKATMASLEENGGNASSEAKRLANTTTKALAAAVGSFADHLQGLAARITAIDVTRLLNSTPSILKSEAVSEARKRARGISDKLKARKTNGLLPKRTAQN